LSAHVDAHAIGDFRERPLLEAPWMNRESIARLQGAVRVGTMLAWRRDARAGLRLTATTDPQLRRGGLKGCTSDRAL